MGLSARILRQSTVPTGNVLATEMVAKVRQKLSDSYIEAVRDFAEGETATVWDAEIKPLRVTVGKHRITFSYFQQHRIHGKRSASVIVLGHYPVMNVATARKAALVHAGRIAAGRITPGKRTAVRFETAFADYHKHLEHKATSKGKNAKWAYNAQSIANTVLLPEFSRWPLADLSHAPGVVRDWHLKVTKDRGPVLANRAASILRSCYRYAAKLNRQLPPALPTSAVLWNVEEPAEKGVTDFKAWAKAWGAVPSPVRRGYHLANLLLGTRGGELARLEWRDIDARSRSLLLRNVKSQGSKKRNVRLPLSLPIVRALKLAKGADAVMVFPGCRFNPQRDGLPEFGHALRHAYESIATEIGVDPLFRKMLIGHSIGRGADVTDTYASRKMLTGALGHEQRRISTEIVKRLGIKL